MERKLFVASLRGGKRTFTRAYPSIREAIEACTERCKAFWPTVWVSDIISDGAAQPGQLTTIIVSCKGSWSTYLEYDIEVVAY